MGELINLNALIQPSQIDPAIATDAEVTAAINAHVAATDTQYLSKRPTHVEFGVETYNIIDFHGGIDSIDMDFDVRILQDGGIGQNGKGNLSIQANRINLISALALNGGVAINRVLAVQTYIDLPPITSQGIYDIFVSIPGAQMGDVVFFCPLADLYIGLWACNIQAAITANGVARIYFHNLYFSTLDVAAFSAKVIVIGF